MCGTHHECNSYSHPQALHLIVWVVKELASICARCFLMRGHRVFWARDSNIWNFQKLYLYISCVKSSTSTSALWMQLKLWSGWLVVLVYSSFTQCPCYIAYECMVCHPEQSYRFSLIVFQSTLVEMLPLCVSMGPGRCAFDRVWRKALCTWHWYRT